jgi:hypothetical protein
MQKRLPLGKKGHWIKLKPKTITDLIYLTATKLLRTNTVENHSLIIMNSSIRQIILISRPRK